MPRNDSWIRAAEKVVLHFPGVYAVRIGDDVWVVHVFRKKSKTGIKTPKEETNVICDRLERTNEVLK